MVGYNFFNMEVTLKEFLHTPQGAEFGFKNGIKGYNMVKVRVLSSGDEMVGYNSRVNRGAGIVASLMTASTLGSATGYAAPLYIALSTASLTPASGDTTLTSETSATGLARALGTVQNYTAPTSLDAGASYQLYKLFTNTSGSSVTIQSAAIFDASSTGNLFVEANLSSSATVPNNDKLEVTWTVNI